METLEYTTEQDITFEDLTKGSREIAAIIGIPATIRLVNKHRGRNVYIPAHVAEDMELVKLLGMPAVVALSDAFGTDNISIPMERQLERKLRDRKLLARRKTGATAAQLAKEFDLTMRHVWQLLRQNKDKKGSNKR